MNYQAFHCSRIGAAHIQNGLPLQDSSDSKIYHGYAVAAAADGHGSRRHFRSDTGSNIACQCAISEICKFIQNDSSDKRHLDDRLIELKQNICIHWREAVYEDYLKTPWTESELAEMKQILNQEQYERLVSGQDAVIPYGTTLCVVFANKNHWIALQIGDGGFVCIKPDGEYLWPMPESQYNEGNRTFSLCLRDPMQDFRHCYGEDQPVGLLVFSDGIDKVFPPQGKDIVSFLHWAWKNELDNTPSSRKNLEDTLDTLTRRSRIGDDVSIAGIVDMDAKDVEPLPTSYELISEETRNQARIQELKSTIAYNQQRLKEMRKYSEDPEAIEKIASVIQRNRPELAKLIPDDQISEDEPDTEEDSDPDWGADSEEDSINSDPIWQDTFDNAGLYYSFDEVLNEKKGKANGSVSSSEAKINVSDFAGPKKNGGDEKYIRNKPLLSNKWLLLVLLLAAGGILVIILQNQNLKATAAKLTEEAYQAETERAAVLITQAAKTSTAEIAQTSEAAPETNEAINLSLTQTLETRDTQEAEKRRQTEEAQETALAQTAEIISYQKTETYKPTKTPQPTEYSGRPFGDHKMFTATPIPRKTQQSEPGAWHILPPDTSPDDFIKSTKTFTPRPDLPELVSDVL